MLAQPMFLLILFFFLKKVIFVLKSQHKDCAGIHVQQDTIHRQLLSRAVSSISFLFQHINLHPVHDSQKLQLDKNSAGKNRRQNNLTIDKDQNINDRHKQFISNNQTEAIVKGHNKDFTASLQTASTKQILINQAECNSIRFVYHPE